MAKSKFYVVWVGRQPGVYKSWDECKAQVDGFEQAKYKSYSSEQEAQTAYKQGWKKSFSGASKRTASNKGTVDKVTADAAAEEIIWDSLSVDAACSGNPGLMEYQGVDTQTGERIFHQGPFPKGTNNIGEFLAIVHALAMLKQQGSNRAIYSDSVNAINWVKKRKAATTLVRDAETEALWTLIERAESWLASNKYSNPIIKWQTKQWGEIKADFGRK